jgi:hypothetical protein
VAGVAESVTCALKSPVWAAGSRLRDPDQVPVGGQVLFGRLRGGAREVDGVNRKVGGNLAGYPQFCTVQVYIMYIIRNATAEVTVAFSPGRPVIARAMVRPVALDRHYLRSESGDEA